MEDRSIAKQPKVLILGAGHDQKGAFLAARELGWKSIAVDQNPRAMCLPLADQTLVCRSAKTRDIIALLGPTKPDAIVAPASDAWHRTVRELNQYFGLCHHVGWEAERSSCDKGYFHKILDEIGLDHPPFLQVNDLAVAERWFLQKDPDLHVVKPSDNNGSKGISQISSLEELRSAFDNARRFSRNGQVIIERWIEGGHYSVEAFRSRGRNMVFAISQRRGPANRVLVTTSHFLESPSTFAQYVDVERKVSLIAEHLGIDNGPLNIDFIADGERIVFLEMAARLAGNAMPHLLKMAHGVDTYRQALLLAYHQQQDENVFPMRRYAGVLVLTSFNRGTFSHISGFHETCAEVDEAHLEMFVCQGDHISPFTKSSEKLGYLLIADRNSGPVRSVLSNGRSKIQVNLMNEGKINAV